MEVVTEQITIMDRAKVSWRNVIAGVFTTFAVSIVMALLGLALGFTVIDPLSRDPLSGLGTAFGAWSIFSILLSLAAGGFVAGFFAGARGWEHGFLVWATVILVGTILAGMVAGATAGAVGTAVGAVGRGAAGAASAVAQSMAGMVSDTVDAVRENVDFQQEAEELGDDVTSVLRDTGVEALQPEALRAQSREAAADLRSTVNRLAVNPDNYDTIIGDFLTRQGQRIDAITAEVDRNAAVTALMRQRDMTRPEAEQAVDNALRAYRQAVDGARLALDEGRQRLEEARTHLNELTQKARLEADRIANAAAASSLAAAVALIIGAVVCCLAGLLGGGRSAIYYR